MKKGKVTVIGAGFVGSTTAFALMQSSVVNEIVIIDINKQKAEGDALDMSHGVPFMKPIKVTAGDYVDSADSEIVIITAGANQKPGETRIDLLKKNAAIFKSIIDGLTPYITHETTILVVTNPVDILTYLTYKLSGFPASRVIGSGTVLDTARFRYSLGEHVGIDARNIHAYIIGEHGDTEVAVWSSTSIGQIPMDEYCRCCTNCSGINKYGIYEKVKNSAYEIIQKKGATYYAVALAVKRIVECLMRNERSILTVSSLLTGQYGIDDVCISVPCVVGKNGIEKTLQLKLSDEELSALRSSADTLKKYIREMMEE
ncbi:MAG: L-lactate dehydrogenase [Firmicutes bacterium ADurb.Bin193]|nr:MAG: L-lactate dehydrogenase [Firmicutes bacterium ADurb.Bin193]